MKDKRSLTAGRSNGFKRGLHEVQCVAFHLIAQRRWERLRVPSDRDEVRWPAVDALARQPLQQAAANEAGRSGDHHARHEAIPCISTQAGFDAADAHQDNVAAAGSRIGPNAVATRVHVGRGPASASRPFLARL